MADPKPVWERVRFGDVVRLVKDRVNPQTAGLARYVAGEHMETDDLRIRRWGDVDDGYLGPAFHMRFKPGQVLYGSRRTYLRKVALPDFEGICANTTFVLESADASVLLPELLPFIMQTADFHEHSKRESKGSVNPYVNFSDLAWYEFALPSLDEQRRLVDLLHAYSHRIQEQRRLAEQASSLFASAAWSLTLGRTLGSHRPVITEWTRGRPPSVASLPKSWRVATLSQVARLESGHTPSRRHPEYWSGDIPWISLGDVGNLDVRYVTSTVEQVTDLGIANSSARLLPTHTVVLSRTATVGRVTMLGVPMATSQDYVNFVCDSGLITPPYLYFYFRALKPYWRFIAEGGGVRTIYFPFFKELQVPVPPLSVQADVAESLIAVEDAASSAHCYVMRALEEWQRVVNGCMTGAYR